MLFFANDDILTLYCLAFSLVNGATILQSYVIDAVEFNRGLENVLTLMVCEVTYGPYVLKFDGYTRIIYNQQGDKRVVALSRMMNFS